VNTKKKEGKREMFTQTADVNFFEEVGCFRLRDVRAAFSSSFFFRWYSRAAFLKFGEEGTSEK
jgi:hypothetical protein